VGRIGPLFCRALKVILACPGFLFGTTDPFHDLNLCWVRRGRFARDSPSLSLGAASSVSPGSFVPWFQHNCLVWRQRTLLPVTVPRSVERTVPASVVHFRDGCLEQVLHPGTVQIDHSFWPPLPVLFFCGPPRVFLRCCAVPFFPVTSPVPLVL